MPDLLAFPGPVACLVVLGFLVVESGLLVGVFLPGDSLLFAAGLLVGTGRVDVPIAVLAVAAWLGAVLGDGLEEVARGQPLAHEASLHVGEAEQHGVHDAL
jgi:membrane-associated protein